MILKKSPKERAINPRFIWTVEKPIFKALKKNPFTGPGGKRLPRKWDNAEPIIPPMIIPNIIVGNFLFAAINHPLFAIMAKHADERRF